MTTYFFLTDGLGSVLGVFSNTAGSAALLSDQLFTPYGTQLLSNGNTLSQYTNKGFTGQYNDAVSGLNYYVSRYYDPVAGVFLSADKKLGNPQGANPYNYVGNNPETDNDPTGQYYASPTPLSQQGGQIAYVWGNVITTVTNDNKGIYWTVGGQQTYSLYGGLSISSSTTQQITKYGGYNPATDWKNSPLAKFAQVTGWTQLQQSWNAPGATTLSRLEALGRFGLTNANNLLQLAAIFGGPEDEVATAAEDTALEEGTSLAEDVSKAVETESSPTTMEGMTSRDLYRQGGIQAGPKLGYAREGQEAFGGLVSPDRGTSLWASMFKGEKLQGWWQLPAGTSIPEGYRFVYTGIINGVEHWEFRPIQEVTVQAFEEAANSITGWIWMGKF